MMSRLFEMGDRIKLGILHGYRDIETREIDSYFWWGVTCTPRNGFIRVYLSVEALQPLLRQLTVSERLTQQYFVAIILLHELTVRVGQVHRCCLGLMIYSTQYGLTIAMMMRMSKSLISKRNVSLSWVRQWK
jgi:hypothetical protein